uniref:WGS project CBMI000000000 data, contig CS3069_c004926 n=1 Tax=Fusarium clavum TaxID=2594811 RepID=A0A090MEW9_9HYPO|nr:unnamed protein product [Fusarium clavum]
MAEPVSEAQRTFLKKWEHATEAVSDTLGRLHFHTALMRNIPVEHLEYSVSTIMIDDDTWFRKDIASLSAANRRYKGISVANDYEDGHLEPKIPADFEIKDRRVFPPTTATGPTQATSLDLEAQVTAKMHTLMSPATPMPMSPNSMPQNDSFEYPILPKASPRATCMQCSFCFVELELKGSDEDNQEQWKRHVDQDIKPYSCLFPQCSNSLHFFVHFHEWQSHMDSVHSKDWMQRVHTKTWSCDIDHDTPLTFESEREWSEHFFIPASHPSLKKLPTRYQLDAYCTEIEKYVPRGQFVCPLCERIPDEILPETERETLDASRIHSLLTFHVANHIKSLALMAVPSIEARVRDVDDDKPSMAISGDSVVHPPSGQDSNEQASLPPEH